MSNTVMILVSDSLEKIEEAKKYWESHDVKVYAYSSVQWREGMDNNYFRQQLVAGVPSLVTGSHAVVNDTKTNILQFPNPTTTNHILNHVEKMEDLEAKAIENAIAQYKGNLTEAAKALGIGRATLYRKVKQYHIDPSTSRKKKSAPVAA